MSDKVFIDSNLLIYSVSTEMSKRAAVESLFQKNYDFVISIQVVNEFSNVCFKKNLLSATDLEKLVNGFFAFFKVLPSRPALSRWRIPLRVDTVFPTTMRSLSRRLLKMIAPCFSPKICNTIN